MKKMGRIMVAVAMISAVMCVPAYAEVQFEEWGTAGWKQVDGGIKWKYTDDTYASPGWHWLNEYTGNIAAGVYDFDSECYYFDQDGYLLTDTTTPDGYTVDATGAWTVDGEVQHRSTLGREEWGIIVHNKTAADFDTSFLSGEDPLYNQYGVSRTAISMLNNTREENAKYGEISAAVVNDGYRDGVAVTYANGFKVRYVDPEPTTLNGKTIIRRWSSVELDMSKAVIDSRFGDMFTGIDGTIFLKYYFPNHQYAFERGLDSDEKWNLFREFGFPISESAADFYVDEVILHFSDGGQKYLLTWYCTNKIVLNFEDDHF